MRRLARHLFTLCAAVSLLLCVVACVLWARSWRRYDGVSWDYCGRVLELGTVFGVVEFEAAGSPLRSIPIRVLVPLFTILPALWMVCR